LRARNIKPGFFKNELLAELPFEARLLFVGLWCLADREGRLEDRTKRIEAEIFPYEKIDVEKYMHALASTNPPFIIRYEANKNRYVQIINFSNHQNPNPHEKKSEIPSCKCKAQSKKCIAPLNPLPPSLNPESLSPPAAKAARVFESLWQEYPKRLGKKEALRHFTASVKTDVDVSDIRIALQKFRAHIQGREKRYIPNGSTWFNNWRDWIDFEEEKNGTNDGKSPVSYADIARAKRQAESLRKESSAQPIPAGIRDMPDVQVETEPGDRGGHNTAGRLASPVAEERAVESQQPGGENSS
jgi:hypothetical protein